MYPSCVLFGHLNSCHDWTKGTFWVLLTSNLRRPHSTGFVWARDVLDRHLCDIVTLTASLEGQSPTVNPCCGSEMPFSAAFHTKLVQIWQMPNTKFIAMVSFGCGISSDEVKACGYWPMQSNKWPIEFDMFSWLSDWYLHHRMLICLFMLALFKLRTARLCEHPDHLHRSECQWAKYVHSADWGTHVRKVSLGQAA